MLSHYPGHSVSLVVGSLRGATEKVATEKVSATIRITITAIDSCKPQGEIIIHCRGTYKTGGCRGRRLSRRRRTYEVRFAKLIESVASWQVPGKTPGAGLRFTLPRQAAHTGIAKARACYALFRSTLRAAQNWLICVVTAARRVDSDPALVTVPRI
jgi:hypothetical protein